MSTTPARLTAYVSHEHMRQLAALSRARNCTVSYLTKQIIEKYLAYHQTEIRAWLNHEANAPLRIID